MISSRLCGLELSARGDAELRVHLSEVPFDGSCAEEEFRADLGIGVSISSEADNVLLLRGQVIARTDVASADVLPGGDQLATRPLGERLGTHRDEGVVRDAQL